MQACVLQLKAGSPKTLPIAPSPEVLPNWAPPSLLNNPNWTFNNAKLVEVAVHAVSRLVVSKSKEPAVCKVLLRCLLLFHLLSLKRTVSIKEGEKKIHTIASSMIGFLTHIQVWDVVHISDKGSSPVITPLTFLKARRPRVVLNLLFVLLTKERASKRVAPRA